MSAIAPSRTDSTGPPLRPARLWSYLVHHLPAPHAPYALKAPCRRCQLSGTPCVFEKPEKKNAQPMANGSVESVLALPSSAMVDITDPDTPYGRRLSRLEGQYLVCTINRTSGPLSEHPAEGRCVSRSCRAR